jgi:(E)-4-hydroxy-3-methylbut-2-enyl-diphosphate synthase
MISMSLKRPDAADELRRMATARSPGGPTLEGILVPSGQRDLMPMARAAAPGLGIALDGPNGVREDLPGTWAITGNPSVADYRRLAAAKPGTPVVIDLFLPTTDCCGEGNDDDALLYGAAVAGSLLCDGIGDAVRFGGPHEPERLLEVVLGVLQACRLRASRTEYIACPGCGRTLFDLESTTQRIKARTGHLPGVKIAVMGCIVNGPGEMADADFGYVGSAPGFVNLYVGKDIVERSVPQADADERLIALLKSHGVWREPATAATT